MFHKIGINSINIKFLSHFFGVLLLFECLSGIKNLSRIYSSQIFQFEELGIWRQVRSSKVKCKLRSNQM
jgi:hypothetical protein